MARRRGGNESQPRRPGTQRAPASVPVGTAPATRRAVGVRYNRNGSSGWAAVPIVSAMGPRSVLLATLVSVALAACGGGGSSSAVRSSSSVPASTTTTSGVAKDSYILQADVICADMNSQVRAAASTSADPGVQASSIRPHRCQSRGRVAEIARVADTSGRRGFAQRRVRRRRQGPERRRPARASPPRWRRLGGTTHQPDPVRRQSGREPGVQHLRPHCLRSDHLVPRLTTAPLELPTRYVPRTGSIQRSSIERPDRASRSDALAPVGCCRLVPPGCGADAQSRRSSGADAHVLVGIASPARARHLSHSRQPRPAF